MQITPGSVQRQSLKKLFFRVAKIRQSNKWCERKILPSDLFCCIFTQHHTATFQMTTAMPYTIIY